MLNMGEKNIFENDGKEVTSIEEFEALSDEEKYDYVASWMQTLMEFITSLAREVSAQNERRNEFENEVKSVAKSFEGMLNQNTMVKDILYDRVGFSGLKDYIKFEHYKKEVNPLRRWIV